MTDKPHEVRASWRELDARAAEERAKALSDWLEHTEDLIAMFGEAEKATKELRSVAGIVRMRLNDFTQKANELRAELLDQNRSPD